MARKNEQTLSGDFFLDQGKETNKAAGSLEEWYHSYRRYALSIAYRMLGSMADAEDVVQDCFVELHRKPGNEVRKAKSYIAKMTVNRCLNLLGSAGRTRETYVGEWLPEPVPGPGPVHAVHVRLAREQASGLERAGLFQGNGPAAPEDALERKDMISYAFLVMLERLNPLERAVFVLREGFGYDYKEIAGMLGKTESNCRQLYSRSRRTLAADGPYTEENYALPGEENASRRQLLERFTNAFLAYDAQALLELLAEQPEFISDGGGFVHTVLRPMKGLKGVLAILTSRRILTTLREAKSSLLVLNGELQVVFRDKDTGKVGAILCPALDKDGKVQSLYLIVNPHKLELVSAFLLKDRL